METMSDGDASDRLTELADVLTERMDDTAERAGGVSDDPFVSHVSRQLDMARNSLNNLADGVRPSEVEGHMKDALYHLRLAEQSFDEALERDGDE